MNDVVLTFDVDWAPDFIIDFIAGQLIERRVKTTWFVTHLSPAVVRLREYADLFELGIHPNFRSNSTHGRTTEEILRHCLTLVPEAISMRTHSLMQSTPLFAEILRQTKIMRDVSIFLPHSPDICPHEFWWKGRCLLRIPFYWEEDFEMQYPQPCWQLEPLLNVGNGLKIFNFHPIHIYLNSANMGAYFELKKCVPSLSEVTPQKAKRFIQEGEGTQTLFNELITYLSDRGPSLCIRDIAIPSNKE